MSDLPSAATSPAEATSKHAEERAAAAPGGSWLRVAGTRIVDEAGATVTLRGVGVGGWLNMENFITGYPTTESLQRAAMRAAMGDDAYGAFFRKFTGCFFDERDAEYLASLGVNCVRLPVNHRLLTGGAEHTAVRSDDLDFSAVDRAVRACSRHGIYTVLDLHTFPGGQNGDWHSDNPTHYAALWDDPLLLDEGVALWEGLAARYAGSPWVAGYNLINEPAHADGSVVAAYYERLAAAVRAVDPRHILFLDGNTYGTDFSAFGELASRLDNVVFAAHDYALPGIAADGVYPGSTRGEWFDKSVVEASFLRRTAFMRETGTPIWIGEFGPIYTGDPAVDAMRYRLLRDQLDIYAAHGAGWSLWTYKDLGMQGLATVRADSPYVRRIASVLEKKKRLGVDSWGGSQEYLRPALKPLEDLVAKEFPETPETKSYPWGAKQRIGRLVRNILLAELMLPEFGECFRGVDAGEAEVLAASFDFGSCELNSELASVVRSYAGALWRSTGGSWQRTTACRCGRCCRPRR